jgi:hypothetical protein
MKIINYLLQQANKQAIMTNKLTRYFLGPLVCLLSVIGVELTVLLLGWPIIMAIPYAALSLTVYRWSGFRSSLASAFIVSLYPLYHLEWYGPLAAGIVILGAFLIAAPSGILKRALREQALEAETNRRKAELVDNLNGNLQTMLRSLSILDKLRVGWDDFTEAKRFELIEESQGLLVNLLTMTRSWREIAETKEKATDYLNQISGYPYRVDDAIRNIEANQRETLRLIMYLNRTLEGGKYNPSKTQELKD